MLRTRECPQTTTTDDDIMMTIPLVLPRGNDLTFSFGRDTNMGEVMSLLTFSGCIDMETYHDDLRMVRINNKKKDNGQVLITYPSGQSDSWVSKLERFEGKVLKKLHSYVTQVKRCK